MKMSNLRRALGNGPKLPQNVVPVPLVYQETDFSCGPAALLAVLQYFGADKGADEHDLYGELGTTSKWGTSPEPMAAAADARGVEAEYEPGFSLDGLRHMLSQGGVAIVGIQAWPDDDEGDYGHDTADGHYVVAIGMDTDNLYVMDPSLEGAYGFMSLDSFSERWHDVEADGEFQHHPAIVCYGQPVHDEPETQALAEVG